MFYNHRFLLHDCYSGVTKRILYLFCNIYAIVVTPRNAGLLNNFVTLKSYPRLIDIHTKKDFMHFITPGAMPHRSFQLILLLLLSSLTSAAANYKIQMTVCDSIGEPEIYATVRIFAENDSVKPALVGTTDYDGKFSGTVSTAGKYTLKLAATGKKPFESIFTIKSVTAGADLGKIVMSENAEMLNEITVTALRPLIKREIDRITFDVGADTEAPTSTLSETLRKVPMVTVDADGTIRVKGQTDFRIYKNNRPNSSYTNNAKELFKAIPATSIKRIEVITDPGAREDAEGGAGLILNIVTDSRTRMMGVTGNVNQNISFPTLRESTNAYITTQIDKVTLSANGMFSYAPKSKYTRSESTSETTYEASGLTSRTKSESRSASKFGYWGVEGSWEPDTLNLVTLEVSQWIPGSFKPDMKSTTTMTDSEGNLSQQYSSTYGDPYKVSSFYLDGAVNYQRLTRRKDEAITLSYKFSVNNSENETNTIYSELVNWTMPYTEYYQRNKPKFAEHTFQLDWTRPYFGIAKFDVGGKLILRRNSSRSTICYDDYSYLSENDFRHRTTVAALYADWRVKLKKWNFRAGVRYEYTYLSAHSVTAEGKNFGIDLDPDPSWSSADDLLITHVHGSDYRKELNDIVPNATVMYELNDENQLKVSYQRNIRRPSIGYLDPTETRLPQSVSYGNPHLKSATIDNIELGYEHMGGALNYMASVYATLSSDGFASVSWVGEDGQTIYNTYANTGKYRAIGLSQWLGWNGKKTRIYAGFNVGYDYYKQPTPDGAGHDVNISLGRWWTNPYIFASQKLPWDLNLSMNLNYWSGGLSSAYSWSTRDFLHGFFCNFSLSRGFLKEKRLNIRLSVTKPLTPSIRNKSYTVMPGSRSWSLNESYGSQSLYISIGYRFGSLKAYVKKTNASISNDDLGGGSSKGGQSGN